MVNKSERELETKVLGTSRGVVEQERNAECPRVARATGFSTRLKYNTT